MYTPWQLPITKFLSIGLCTIESSLEKYLFTYSQHTNKQNPQKPNQITLPWKTHKNKINLLSWDLCHRTLKTSL